MSALPDPPPVMGAPDNGLLLRLIFDHAVEGLSVFDAELTLRAWNQRFLDFTGLPPEQVRLGARLEDLLRTMAQAGTGELAPRMATVDKPLLQVLGWVKKGIRGQW